MSKPIKQPMIFKNFGGIYQLQVSDAEDLARIETLDPARWAATSAPLRDLHCDAVFLSFLDPDKTGRIRVSQLVAGRDWLFKRLAKRDRIKAKSDVLALGDLDSAQEPGKSLKAAAEHVLKELKATKLDELTLGQVRAFRASYAQTLANGDGVVCPEVLSAAEVAQFAKDIMATVGSVPEISGRPGVGLPEVDKFLARAKAYLEWKARPETNPAILPLGADTASAVGLVRELDPKIEEFFSYCDLIRQEAQAAGQLQATIEELKALKAKDAATIEKYLAGYPLAMPNAEGRLLVVGPINPVFQEKFDALRAKVLPPEATELTRGYWRELKKFFAPYETWQKEKPAEPFDKLSDETLKGYLEGAAPELLRGAIAIDKDATDELASIADLEKLILFQRWLVELVNNFVNFSAIYHPEQNALIEMGSLILDGRRFEFSMKVDQREAHKKIAIESQIFLIYASITEQEGKAPSFEVVTPVTAGERGRVRIGKRGIFIDLNNKEWDAQVVDIIENPISIGEAIRAPFRRASQFVSKKIEDLAASQLSSAEKSMHEGLDKKVTAAATAPAPPPAAGAGGMSNLQGLLIGGSVAFAAVGSAMAYIFSALAKINLAAVVVLIAALVGLSALLGWLKLRRRDMALLLEANGWAVNVHMEITSRLGRLFTRTPGLPKGSKKDRTDVLLALMEDEQDAEKAKRKRRRRVVLLILLAAAIGALVYWLQYMDGWKQVQSWRKQYEKIEKLEAEAAPK